MTEFAKASRSNSYDEVPYDSHPFAQTHPDRLATVGTLFGMRPTAVDQCRVLELGVASGGNLIPMAEEFPNSQFVGIDLSERQITEGKGIIQTLGLSNIELHHADIADIDHTFGNFDYILCHGVFSWVPTAVQEKIFEICANQLTAQGIAYISYNTYPGWHMRGMIRDMMRYHAERFNTATMRTRQARALLDFLAQSVKQEGPYHQMLKNELQNLQKQADHYLFHEHLEEVNDPLYFHEFAERAQAKGLRYLGEARVGTMILSNFGPDIEKTLRMLATDQIMVEQYMDFLRNRMFRETLLCSNKAQTNWQIQPGVLTQLHVASWATPVQEDFALSGNENISFKSPTGMSMATNQPLLKAAMQLLRQVWPGTIPFGELRQQARQLLGNGEVTTEQAEQDQQILALGLLNCYMGSDLVELRTQPLKFTREISERPVANSIARLQTPRMNMVTNRRHEVVRLNDLDRHLIPLLDGSHDRGALLEKLTELTVQGSLTIQRDNQPLKDREEIRAALEGVIEPSLQGLARHALLVG